MESQESVPQVMSDIPSREEHEEAGISRQLPRLVFVIASIGFLAFLAIGSVEARIWRFGRLYFEDRTVREVWAYFGDRLPDMPGQPVFTALYWISIAVIVLATLVGLWLFLGTGDDDPATEAASNAPDSTLSTHA
jgi:hypothetical protein